MVVCHGSELREMGNAEYLAGAADLHQLFRDQLGRTAADTGIDLVKNQGFDPVVCREHRAKREHDARQLAAARNLAQRLDRFAGIGANIKFRTLAALFRLLFEANFKARILEIKGGQLPLDTLRERGGSGVSKTPELLRSGLQGSPSGFALLLQSGRALN